jgi:hypothetical protein
VLTVPRLRESSSAVLVVLASLAPRAFAALPPSPPCDSLLDRLPPVVARYQAAVVEDGLAPPTGDFLAWDEYWQRLAARLDSTWTERSGPGAGGAPGLEPSLPSDDEGDWSRPAAAATADPRATDDCSAFLSTRFRLPGGEIAFTCGDATEACIDVPWMVWDTAEGKQEAELPTLYGLNVEGLWCTGAFLVLRLHEQAEYGSELEGLAFWNLESGRMTRIMALTLAGDDFDTKKSLPDPADGLGLYLRDLAGARIGAAGDAVVAETHGRRLVFRPRTREWTMQSVDSRD